MQLLYRYDQYCIAMIDNLQNFQEGVYYRLGQLAAMCLVHGGSPIRLLAPSVYAFLCGYKPSDIVVDVTEVPSEAIRTTLIKVCVSFKCLGCMGCTK